MKYNRQKLTDMLIVHEGCVLTVYLDSLGIDTIGIGRNIQHRGITDKELTYLGYYDIIDVYAEGITEDGARHLLENDISIVER